MKSNNFSDSIADNMSNIVKSNNHKKLFKKAEFQNTNTSDSVPFSEVVTKVAQLGDLLDRIGFDKTASAALFTLETIISEAQEKSFLQKARDAASGLAGTVKDKAQQAGQAVQQAGTAAGAVVDKAKQQVGNAINTVIDNVAWDPNGTIAQTAKKRVSQVASQPVSQTLLESSPIYQGYKAVTKK